MLAVIALFVALWPRRIIRPDVTRTAPDEVVIRFAPWYEGFVYAALLLTPVSGTLMLISALSGSPAAGKKLFGAVLVLLVSPFIPWGCARMRRRCFLRITPAALRSGTMGVRWVPATQHVVAPQSDRVLTREEIERVSAWTPKQAPVDRRWVGLSFRAAPEGPLIRREVGGSQLTVEPDNLLHALQAWKDSDPDEPPTVLMDRIEAILKGPPQTGPDHRHWAGGSGSLGLGALGAAMFLGDAAAGVIYKGASNTAPDRR
jgi:hypothetical protein